MAEVAVGDGSAVEAIESTLRDLLDDALELRREVVGVRREFADAFPILHTALSGVNCVLWLACCVILILIFPPNSGPRVLLAITLTPASIIRALVWGVLYGAPDP